MDVHCKAPIYYTAHLSASPPRKLFTVRSNHYLLTQPCPCAQLLLRFNRECRSRPAPVHLARTRVDSVGRLQSPLPWPYAALITVAPSTIQTVSAHLGVSTQAPGRSRATQANRAPSTRRESLRASTTSAAELAGGLACSWHGRQTAICLNVLMLLNSVLQAITPTKWQLSGRKIVATWIARSGATTVQPLWNAGLGTEGCPGVQLNPQPTLLLNG